MLKAIARCCWIQNTVLLTTYLFPKPPLPKMESAARIALHVSQKEGANTLQCHACIYTCWHIWKKLVCAYTSMHGICFSKFVNSISCSEESHTKDSCSRLPKTMVYPYINKNQLLPSSSSADLFTSIGSKNRYTKTGLGANTDSISTSNDVSSDGAIWPGRQNMASSGRAVASNGTLAVDDRTWHGGLGYTDGALNAQSAM